jgi:hypothetical protein
VESDVGKKVEEVGLLFRYIRYVVVCATYFLKSFFVGPVSKVWW